MSISPWESLRTLGLPNIVWCEAHRHGWVTEPANTWSNLAYIFWGLLLLYKKSGIPSEMSSKTNRIMGFALIFLGVASFVYHMSYTFFFQIGDFLGMFVLMGHFVAINIKRWRAISWQQVFYAAWALVSLFMIPFWIMRVLEIRYQLLIPVFIILIIASEILAHKHDPLPLGRFYFSFSLILLAFTFTTIDLKRLWCQPESIIQGHSLWHLFSATAIYFLARYVERSNINRTC